MKAVGFSTKVYVFVQNELIRNTIYHIVVHIIEYFSIFLSMIDSNFKLGVLQQDVINQIDFLKYINPLFYYKKLLTCSTDKICMLTDFYYYTTFCVIVGLIFLISIYKYFANFQIVFKSFYKGINLIIINLLDLFFRIGGIFIYYLLLNKFMGGIYEFTNCTQNNCYISFISVITSLILFICFFLLNIKYYLLCKVYLNIENKEFPYENLFSTKFNIYLVFMKSLISVEENLDNYNTLNYLTNFIRLTKICTLTFFVIFIFSKVTSRSRLYVIGSKLNTFRNFLLIFNFIFLLLTIVINDGLFFYCYNLIISICASLPLSILINRLNTRSIFCDETLISQFIYFLNILRNEEGNIELMDDSYCRFLKYHLEYCNDDICHLCKNYIESSEDTRESLSSSLNYVNKYNLMKNIHNSSSNFSSSGKFNSEVRKINDNQKTDKIIFSLDQGASSSIFNLQSNMNLAYRKKNNTSNLSQSKNQGSNPKVTDSSMLNFEENREKTTHSSRGLELINKIIEQIKFRMSYETSANDYTSFDKIYFKILRISLKNLFRLNIFTSIFRFKRLLRRKDLGTLQHNLYYYMQSFCLKEIESSKQFTTVKKYEETLNLFICSVNDLEDLFIKVASGVVFGIDLFKLAEDLKTRRIKSNENLNYLSGVIFANEINENLITLLTIIFRFIYNEFPNNHLAIYFKDYLALERRLNEFYFAENYIIGKYNTTDDSISLIQLVSSELNIVRKQNERNFDKLFHPLIRKQCKDMLAKKIKELDTQNLRRIDLLVRGEKDSLEMIALKAKVIPSLDFEESIILGNFQFLKHDFVLVEKNFNFFTSEIQTCIALLSKSMSEYLNLPCHILKKLKDKKIRFLFHEIFEAEAKNSANGEKNEYYIIRYDKLFLIYKGLISSSDSNEIFLEKDLEKIKEKIDSKLKIKFILKKKDVIKGNKEKDKEYLLYTFKLKKFNEKENLQEGDILNGMDNLVDPNLINQGETDEMQSLFLESSAGRDSVHKTIESVSASSDFDIYNIRKDSKVNINNQNKNYNQKIKLITLIVTIFNFLTILIIIVFVYINTTKNTDVINLVYTKGDLSVFQYNFYYSIMYSFMYYYLNPYNTIDNNSSPQLNGTKSEYELRKQKLHLLYGNKINIDDLYTYMNYEFSLLIDLVKTKNLDVKNKIYTLQGSDNKDLIYYLITSGDKLQPSYYTFFDLLNILLENARIIVENSKVYEQSNSDEKMLYLKIFNKNYDLYKIIFSNPNDSGESDRINLHKLAYESLINYYEVYKFLENLEILLAKKYEDSLTYLLDMNYIFSITVMILHIILLIICYSTIKVFIYSINSINKNIAENLTNTKTDKLLNKIKNVKNLIYISKDPGEIINTISSTLKKWVEPKSKKSHKNHKNEFFKLFKEDGEVESIIKFNRNKLIKPYIFSMLFLLIIFVFFTGAFLILIISKTNRIRKISIDYYLSSDLSHLVVNNIIFTKILIFSNSTNQDISKHFFDNKNFSSINSNFITDTETKNSNFNKVTELIFEHLRILDESYFLSVKEEFYNLDCAYIYKKYLEDYDSQLKSVNPKLYKIPRIMCESLQFTRNSRNLMFHIIEEINYSNKRIFNSVVNSDRSYLSLKKIFDEDEMWELSAYVIFVVRPIQNFFKEKVMFREYVTAATELHKIVVIFLVLYIFLEIFIFYFANSKFSQTILETNEKFSEFLNCIQ